MVLDLMHVHNLHDQMITWMKISLFGVDNSSSVHVDKKKDTLVLSEGATQGLDDTAITAEDKYPINFTRSGRKFC